MDIYEQSTDVWSWGGLSSDHRRGVGDWAQPEPAFGYINIEQSTDIWSSEVFLQTTGRI